MSYRELLKLTHSVACLFGHLNLKMGDRVLAHCEKTPLTVALYWACLQYGVIYVPLNTSYTDSELEYFIEDAEPSLYIGSTSISFDVDPNLIQLTMNQDGSGTFAEAVEEFDEDRGLVANVSDRHVAAILYTSGTTGRSKGAMLTHGNLLSNVRALVKTWEISREDTLLHALPIYHVHGLFVAIHCSLLSGGRVIFQRKFDASQVSESLKQATVLMGVPTFYTRLLSLDGFNQDSVSNMRLFISGSAPLSEQTFREFKERTGMTILERYGMSETLMNTSNPLDGERIAGTVGFPLTDVKLRVVDSEGAKLSSGEVGSIELKGPNVFPGYWRKPEITEREFTDDGYFVTGDMGVLDHEGRLSIVGREKDLVISGGLNVYPAEVEAAIGEMNQVRDVAVIGAPHSDFGEGVVAVVVLDSESELKVSEVRDFLKDKLAGYKRPQAVIAVEELPYNAMGKVQKKMLREQYVDVFSNT